MRTTETYAYNECVATAAKLELIEAAIELLEDVDVLTEDETDDLYSAGRRIGKLVKTLKDRTNLYVTMED